MQMLQAYNDYIGSLVEENGAIAKTMDINYIKGQKQDHCVVEFNGHVYSNSFGKAQSSKWLFYIRQYLQQYQHQHLQPPMDGPPLPDIQSLSTAM